MAGNPPVDVQQYGQSIWLDFIRRSAIENGDLQRMIDNDGVVGVTSNPTIFQKAIGGSDDYDASLQHMLDLDAHAAFEQLAVEDIQHAADLFRPVYDRTGGRDGYVSLEVSPLLANDTQSTTSEALRLFKLLDRPNVMIKIPATEAGLPAIEEAIAAGVNINVTLIFGIANYLQVAEAYIRGLERRNAAGGDITHITSVASFFLSRIDSAVDKQLDALAGRGQPAARTLRGKAAIASACRAYEVYEELAAGERWQALVARGARPQRLLWASTSTKDPSYSPVKYVEELVVPETVNTMPLETLNIYRSRGRPELRLERHIAEASDVREGLERLEVDLDAVAQQLEREGVAKFVEPFDKLQQWLENQRRGRQAS